MAARPRSGAAYASVSLARARAWLRNEHVLAPADSVRRRAVGAARHKARALLTQRMAERLSAPMRDRLDALIAVGADHPHSPLHQIKGQLVEPVGRWHEAGFWRGWSRSRQPACWKSTWAGSRATISGSCSTACELRGGGRADWVRPGWVCACWRGKRLPTGTRSRAVCSTRCATGRPAAPPRATPTHSPRPPTAPRGTTGCRSGPHLPGAAPGAAVRETFLGFGGGSDSLRFDTRGHAGPAGTPALVAADLTAVLAHPGIHQVALGRREPGVRSAAGVEVRGV